MLETIQELTAWVHGAPCAQLPFANLLKMNLYQLHYFKLDMKNAKEMLLKIKSCNQ